MSHSCTTSTDAFLVLHAPTRSECRERIAASGRAGLLEAQRRNRQDGYLVGEIMTTALRAAPRASGIGYTLVNAALGLGGPTWLTEPAPTYAEALHRTEAWWRQDQQRREVIVPRRLHEKKTAESLPLAPPEDESSEELMEPRLG
jgi:hypothetical protein